MYLPVGIKKKYLEHSNFCHIYKFRIPTTTRNILSKKNTLNEKYMIILCNK